MNFKEFYEDEMLLESLDPGSIATMAVSGLLLGGATLFGIMKLKDMGSNLIDIAVDSISDKLNGKNKYTNVMKKVGNGEITLDNASKIIKSDNKVKNYLNDFWKELKSGGNGRKILQNLQKYIDMSLSKIEMKKLALELLKK